jgi:hypothetical protein
MKNTILHTHLRLGYKIIYNGSYSTGIVCTIVPNNTRYFQNLTNSVMQPRKIADKKNELHKKKGFHAE